MTWILAHFWLTFALACAAATITVCGGVTLAGRKYTGCTRWPLSCACQDDEWDDGWRREPETVEDAAAMTAEWHDDAYGNRWGSGDGVSYPDLPGPVSMPAPRAGKIHPTIFDQLRDDDALIEWDLACQIERLRQHEIGARGDVSRIREIRGELADLRKELCAA